MSMIAWMTRLERLVVARKEPEDALVEMLGLGAFVALLAPIRSGRSTLLRGLKARLEVHSPDALFILLRPDQSADLPREVFLQDLLAKLRLQLGARGVRPPVHSPDPYLELKTTLAALPTFTQGPVVVAVDDLGRIDPPHLRTLLWVFRELYSQRADEGWGGPLGRLAVIVAGSRRLYELTVGQDDQLMSPFNVAELFHLPDLNPAEVRALLDRVHQDGLLRVSATEETLAALQVWTGGHPALIKSIFGEVIQAGGQLTPSIVADAARAAVTHDRTLVTMWERLSTEPAAVDAARQIFVERARPPTNLEIAPDGVRIAYWYGWTMPRDGGFEPRCRLVQAFMLDRLAELDAATTPARPDLHPKPGPLRPPPGRFAPSAFPDGLLHGLAQGNGALFVGAGTSRAAGLPTWAELSQTMAERILATAHDDRELENLRAYLGTEGPLAVAQLLRDRLGQFEYHRVLVETLRKPVQLAPIHHAMTRLRTNLILTTNFDKLLERAFRPANGDDPQVVVSTPQLAMIQTRDGPTVIKLHGDIDHPDTIVLTADDYADYFSRHRALRSFLEYQFSYRTVLFVGFGLKDPNFELVFDEARRLLSGHKRPAYAIMVGINPIEAARWQSRGIHIIDLPSYDDVPAYLEDLAARIPVFTS